MVVNKPIYKWIFGGALIATYLGFFALQATIKMGTFPLIVITLSWCWVFYKVTGINLGNFSGQENKDNKAAD